MSGYDTTILGTSGLVSYWPLNESSGTAATDNNSTNNGTYTGTYTLGQGGIGDGETSVLFDGSTAYVDVPYSSSLQPANVSVEAWVYPSNATLGTCGVVCGNAFSSHVGYELGFNIDSSTASGTASTLNFGEYNGSAWSKAADSGGAGALAASTWYYLAATYDGSNLRLYKNASLVATTAFAGPLVYDTGSAAHFYISHLHGVAGATFFAGRVAKVAVYSVALTGTQITNHYNAATGGGGAAPSTFSVSDPTLSRIPGIH